MPRNGSTCFDATVLGGLSVYVEANIYPSEPDVGIFELQVEITGIFWPKRSKRTRKYYPLPQHMQDRINASADLEHLQQIALESGE